MPAKLDKSRFFTIAEIIELLEMKRFELNPEYQRSELIWSEEKQQRLIDYIIKDLSIGSLFLREKTDKFEVLDGQQRLRTIERFIKNEFTTSPEYTDEYPNKKYQDLKDDTRRQSLFNAFRVNYTLVLTGSESDVSDIFLRLQEGTPLNTPEKLNAVLGKMREFVIEITAHPLFKSVKISKYRFSHRHVAAQIVLLELKTDFKKLSFPNLRIDDLKEMYCKYKHAIPPNLHKNVFGVLELIHLSLKRDSRVIRKKSDLPIFYAFVSYLRKNYAVNFSGFADGFKKFVTNFFVDVEQADITGNDNDQYVRYKRARRRGMTLEGLSEKMDILLELYLFEVPNIRLKDEKRGFDYGQKLAVFYSKDKGICQKCKNKVTWEQASYHHKLPHSEGGYTTVDNCQLMHKKCHNELHQQ